MNSIIELIKNILLGCKRATERSLTASYIDNSILPFSDSIPWEVSSNSGIRCRPDCTHANFFLKVTSKILVKVNVKIVANHLRPNLIASCGCLVSQPPAPKYAISVLKASWKAVWKGSVFFRNSISG